MTTQSCFNCVYATSMAYLPCTVNPGIFPDVQGICRDFEVKSKLSESGVDIGAVLDKFFPRHLHASVYIIDRDYNCSFNWGNYTVLATPERADLYTYDCGVWLDEDQLFVEYPHPFEEDEDYEFPEASGDMTDDELAEVVADIQPMHWSCWAD